MVKKGKWKTGPGPAFAQLPPDIREYMLAEDPDWEWVHTSDWFVGRLFDEGKEFERVACKVIATKELWNEPTDV